MTTLRATRRDSLADGRRGTADEALREALRLGGVWAEVLIAHRTTHTLRMDGGAVVERRSVIDAGADTIRRTDEVKLLQQVDQRFSW